MTLLLRISLRNLFRQKRRNLLLGSAIAIGMALLILANSFANGISDVLFNRIMAFVTGHVSVTFTQNGNRMSPVFRDGPRMLEMVREAAPEVAQIQQAIGIFSRAIGNGRADNVILVSLDLGDTATASYRQDLEANFRLIAGSYENLTNGMFDYPVLIAEDKAKYLRVGMKDVIKVRFQDVEGRQQAARLTVAGIFKPANAFMSAPVFLNLPDLRLLAGYGPKDIPQLYLVLRDPTRDALDVANRLHAALQPPLASLPGQLRFQGREARANAFGYRVDTASRRATGLPSKGVFASASLAEALSLKPGDLCTLSYAVKYPEPGDSTAFAPLTLTGVLPDSAAIDGQALLISDREFYAQFYSRWPAAEAKAPSNGSAGRAWRPDTSHPWLPYLNRQWVLLERTKTTQALQKKWSGITRLKTKATTVDVSTMYETASMVVNLEMALNLITLVAVLVLFFIIQVGVVNTLRMTIRERTREIGTMRSIGMRKGEVRNLFLLETLSLTLISGAVGVGVAFLGMRLLASIAFAVDGNPISMILIGGHLHFVPKAASIALYFLLIMGISTVTAWFPARRAANLQPSDALRHFG